MPPVLLRAYFAVVFPAGGGIAIALRIEERSKETPKKGVILRDIPSFSRLDCILIASRCF